MRNPIRLFGITLAATLLPLVVVYAQIDLSATSLGGGAGDVTAPVTSIASRLDLLMDADSYVPPFYHGRALPSAGSLIKLQAIPYFKRSNGSLIPISDIVFTWKQDDRVIGNNSGLGRSSVALPAAILYGTTNIEVDAQSSDNTRFGSATISIPSAEPPLILYGDDPLLGVTYYRALGNTTNLPATQMTFAAVPYFAAVGSASDPRLTYAWTVNGSPIASDANDPDEITLNAKGSNGQAAVGLTVTQSDDVFLSPNSSWTIHLAGSTVPGFTGSGSGAKNPFTGQSQ
ncbi:MAG TPA: hypothetical protein VMU13_02190 [Candidatus Paceibacterota bacterium]|nr:hypothetical protein [Candidatus Paceibacterota bacterium]